MAAFIFNWTLACVCMGIVFYFLGHTSPVLYILGVGQTGALNTNGTSVYNARPVDSAAFAMGLGSVLTSSTSMLLLLGIGVLGLTLAAATGLLQQVGSFAAIYLIPLFMYLFLMNYVVMPWSSFFINSNCEGNTATMTPEQAAACYGTVPTDGPPSTTNTGGAVPDAIKWPILLIFNFMTVWSVITFIRGG
jgi:hypothetical protein